MENSSISNIKLSKLLLRIERKKLIEGNIHIKLDISIMCSLDQQWGSQ